jgi:RHS repeat-associated protein
VSTYGYDALNRITTIDYSDTVSINPDVKRFYDGASNGKGRFWYFYKGGDFSNGSNVEHTSVDSYDALGKPLVQRQLFKLNGVWGSTHQISRAYNRSGSLTSQTYPSGHAVTYVYDSAGRTSNFAGNLGDGTTRTYSNNINYSPFGGLAREQFGTTTPLYRKSFYNIRGQIFDTRLSSVNDTWDWNRGRLILYYSSNHLWGQSGTDNNGNVRFAENWIPPANATLDQADTLFEDAYSYDALNRLTSVAGQRTSVATGWGNWQQQFRQQYTYDRYGNRTIDAAQTWGTGINKKQFTVNTATNRYGVPSGQTGTMSYDLAGNLVTDSYTGSGAREYDAENRMTRAWGGNNQWQEYSYNADGQRVRRKINGQETWQIYSIGNELLAEYAVNGSPSTPQKEYGYRSGQLLVTATLGGSHSLSGNGTSAYVQAPSSSSLNIVGPITVEAWIKINAIGAPRAIISREAFQQSGTGGGYLLSITDTGKVRLDLFQTHNTYVNLSGATTITTGVWHHVAGVFNGTQMRVYLNGVLDGSMSTTSGPTSGTGNFHIGRFSYSFNPYYFNGLIDDARVSNTAVYTSNFTPSNNLTATGSTKGLWKFDGQTVNDSSGNNNHGALQGGATYSTDAVGGGGSAAQVQWLVADHLGTPRMIVDQTGSLSSLKRHDYLPFGEELFVGRTASIGYTAGDGLRQQFTQKERDVETGLDYSINRSYAFTQGRFTGPDEPFADQQSGDPQSWNLYTYSRNNPLRYIDPDGRGIFDFISENLQKGFNAVLFNYRVTNAELAKIVEEQRTFLFSKTAPDGLLYIRMGEERMLFAFDPAKFRSFEVLHFFDLINDPNTKDIPLTQEMMANAIVSGSSPALRGDNYHPDTVQRRIRPEYRRNPAHDSRSPHFDPRKTPEPPDAAGLFQTSVRADMGTWYARGPNNQIYRYFSDNAGGVHFSGVVPNSQVPKAVLTQLGF